MTRGFLRPLTPYALFQSHQKMIVFSKRLLLVRNIAENVCSYTQHEEDFLSKSLFGTFKTYVKVFLIVLERTTEKTKDNFYDMVHVEVGIP